MPPKRKFSGVSPVVGKKRARFSYTPFYRPLRVGSGNYGQTTPRVTTVVRAAGPIPPRMVAKHKYVDLYSSAGTNIDNNRINLNSMFAPMYTGGHQPYGRDTYAGLYNRYRVFGVRYRITVSSTSQTNMNATIMWNNDPTLETNATLTSERPCSLSQNLSWASPCVFQGHLTLSRITGVPNSTYKSDDRYQATVGTNPSESIIMHILLYDSLGNAVSAGYASVRIELTFYTEWFDPQNIAQS